MAAAGVALVAFAQSPWLCTPARARGPRLRAAIPIYVTWLAARFKDDAKLAGRLFFGAAGDWELVDSLAGGAWWRRRRTHCTWIYVAARVGAADDSFLRSVPAQVRTKPGTAAR